MITDLEIALLAIGELEVKRRKAALFLHARDDRIMELESRLSELEREPDTDRGGDDR